MRIKHSNKSKIWTIVAAMLAWAVLLNYPLAPNGSATMHSAGSTTVHPNQTAAARPADDGTGPLAVTPVLDTPRMVSAQVTSADGGTLAATAANGAVFTLTIPSGALLDAETITMTPIASIPDLPFSGGLAGAGAVQLGPEGLILLAPATLVIQPASPLSIDEQTPFSWHQAGDDFHLFPLTLDVNSMTMAVTHFSGYGAGSGSSGERDAAASHSPARSQSKLEQQTQKASQDARSKLSQNPTKKQAKKAVKTYNSEITDDLLATFASLLDTLNQDLASGNESALRCDLFNVLQTVILLHSYELDLEILGVSGQFVPTVTRALQTLIDKSAMRCGDDITEVGNLLGIAKFGNVLAGSDAALSGLAGVARSAVDAAMKCGTLKFVFDSTVTLILPEQPLTIDIGVTTGEGGVPLTPSVDKDGVTVTYTGHAPLTHKTTTLSIPECGVSESDTDSVLNVISFKFKLNLRVVDCTTQDTPPPSDFVAVIDVGRPIENFQVNCPGGFGVSANTDLWRAQFFCGHQDGAVGGSQFTLTGWTAGGPAGTLCTRDYFQTAAPPCRGFKEATQIEVERAE